MEHQIIAAYAGVAATVIIGLGQLGIIGWGLWQMRKSSGERNRQLDIMETGQREQSRIQADTLGQIGKALDHQGEVLAALLRRPA